MHILKWKLHGCQMTWCFSFRDLFDSEQGRLSQRPSFIFVCYVWKSYLWNIVFIGDIMCYTCMRTSHLNLCYLGSLNDRGTLFVLSGLSEAWTLSVLRLFKADIFSSVFFFDCLNQSFFDLTLLLLDGLKTGCM